MVVWSLLLLIVMAVMVFTTRLPSGSPRGRGPQGRPPQGRPPQGSHDTFVLGPGLRVTEKRNLPDGKVSYRLMKEHLPTPGQRLWRRLMRVFGRPPRPEPAQQDGSPTRYSPGRPPHSAELQSFLEARRRSLERRTPDETKRGPDETLH